MHRGVRLRAAHPRRRLRLRAAAEQLDSHHDLPAHALHVVRQASRRRAAHERDGRGAAQEHRALQPHVHQPSHHHHRLRHARLLHHVLRLAGGCGAFPDALPLPHVRLRAHRSAALHTDCGGRPEERRPYKDHPARPLLADCRGGVAAHVPAYALRPPI